MNDHIQSSKVVFTGHMLDRPGRAGPRFPPAETNRIGARIEQELAILGAQEGYSSGACGGDILFHEAMKRLGKRTHLILPCNVKDFRKDCVEVGVDGDWGARFDQILNDAVTVEILGEQYASDNAMASECCNRVMAGLAARAAAMAGEEPALLALWDGRPGDAVGGTHSMVQFCLANGFRVRLMADLSPNASAQASDLIASPPGATSAIRHPGAADEATQQICAVVFVDAVGFSKLRERDLPKFSRHYLSGVMRVLEAREFVPLVKNTWGDGLFMVFASVREAGLFALDFRDLIVAKDWKGLGLAEDMSVRIGIHAGPLYRIYDPVLGQWSYLGSHVNRAARIEPNTPPGEVYASLTFAALASAERGTGFTCREVGRFELAKGYGEMLAFRIERA